MSERLVAESITKSWADNCVLDGLQLEVDAGEILAVLGPSGCGKTTLLRIVAGLERPDRGTISIGADDVTHASPASRNIGMVFQQHALLPHLDVAENIGFGLSRKRSHSTETADRVRDAASLVACTEFLERMPSTLSGGERQRVALARALVREPRLVLLDEPLSSLDVQDRALLRTELRRSLEASGTTAVHVTHDQSEAFAIGDRVAVVRSGVAQQTGTADELFDSPATIGVASFIGSPPMNLYPVTAGESPTGGPFPVHVEPETGSGGLIAGVRAQDVRLVGVGATGAIPARIIAVEITDETATILLNVADAGDDSEQRVAHTVRAVVPRGGRPHVGESVAIVADADRFHLFDAATGASLHHPLGRDRL